MRFDLETRGDGTVRLVHWDALHGNDVGFLLRKDGSAFKAVRAAGEQQYHLEPADLVSELYRLARKEGAQGR